MGARGDGLVGKAPISVQYGSVALTVVNTSGDAPGKLTWMMLVNTMYGVADFLEKQGANVAEWSIKDEKLGVVGTGQLKGKEGRVRRVGED